MPSRTAGPRLSIGFVLAPRFTLTAFASFVDVLRLAADEGDRSRPIMCRWDILSSSMEPIAASCGTTINPDSRFGDPAAYDYVAVVGGLVDHVPDLDPACVAFIRTAAESGVPLIGICTGAFVLHRAGLMDGHRCCVSWFHHGDFLEAFDGLVPISDQIFVVDRDRITCSGGVSSAHLAAHLVDKHVGASSAHKSLRILIMDRPEEGESPQPGAPIGLQSQDPLVQRALNTMQQTIEYPLTTGKLARRLGCAPSTLRRRFHASLSLTPSQVSRHIRLEEARRLLLSTQKTVSNVASMTGFTDASHLGKALLAKYGMTPTLMRRGGRPGKASVGGDGQLQ